MVYGCSMASRVSLLDGCTQGGQLIGQPCYPCAALVWSHTHNIVRICSPIRPNAGCSAVYVQKAGVVAAFGCLNLFFGLLVRGDLEGSRRAVGDASPRASPS